MSDADMLAQRGRPDKGLRYHRVTYARRDGKWSVAGWSESPERLAKATCGFFSAVGYKVPGGSMERLTVYRTRDE